tara:strand:+ start:126590 stop:126841 length:252 start_codon:yes stop_codon:yes gene_type:complete
MESFIRRKANESVVQLYRSRERHSISDLDTYVKSIREHDSDETQVRRKPDFDLLGELSPVVSYLFRRFILCFGNIQFLDQHSH